MSTKSSVEAKRHHLSIKLPEASYYLDSFDRWLQNKGAVSLAVIKLGGGIIDDPKLLSSSIKAISELSSLGYYPTIVHGGGVQISRRLLSGGIESRFEDGLRVTPRDALTQVELALAEINSLLIERLEHVGIEAVGLSNVFGAVHLDPIKYGEVGSVETVNTDVVNKAVSQRKIPVVSCIGQLVPEGGRYLNINGDDAAAALVRSLNPLKYISFTPLGGVMNNDRIISRITPAIAERMQKDGSLSGGMLKKVDEALNIIKEGGVSEIVIAQPEYLIDELFTKDGHGTIITS